MLSFTEPNVAFSVRGRTGDRIALRVHLSMEAGPPWIEDPPDIYAYAIVLDVSAAELRHAAEDWDTDCAPFPVR